MTSTTIRYPVLPENSHEFARVYPPGFGPGEPYYEPDHLRHRPGDTYEIGGKPHDPEDPGPYGTSGWFQDRRTGRHRRDELPDPLPEAEKPKPSPRGRRRFWFDPEPRESGPYEAERYETETSLSFGFTSLQQDAWERWLVDSEPLAAAHYTRRTAFDRECGPTVALFIRLVQWIAAVLGRPEEPEPTPPARPLPMPRTGDGYNSYINTWELRFDAQNPVTGGGAL